MQRRRPARRNEDSRIDVVLDRLNRIVESLELRVEQPGARSRVARVAAELEAARRLRDTVQAAVGVARAEVATAEANATAVILAAFREFVASRPPRKRSPRRPRQSDDPTPKSMEDLGALAAAATHAVVIVIADRNRLRNRLAEVEVELEALRARAEAERDGGGIAEREALAAHLERELRVAAIAARDLTTAIRRMREKLPAAAAAAAARHLDELRRDPRPN